MNKYEYFLLKRVGKTISDYELIENNDRILVGVSGGKDSLSLLEHRCPFKADITKRTKMKELISSLSRENPHIKRNILKSIEKKEILYKPRRMSGLK